MKMKLIKKENKFFWFPKEKKGAEMTIGIIVVMILALLE